MMVANIYKKRRRGFSLVEMLVAIAVTVIMLGFIWEVFYQTRSVVSRGVYKSDVIATNRSISSQLEQDFTGSANGSGDSIGGIVSPWKPDKDSGEAGFLVIVNRDAANQAPIIKDGNKVDVRDDQLSFILKIPSGGNGNSTITPLTPANSDSYAPSPYATAQYAKVWYGHVLKTMPGGKPVSGDELGKKSGHNKNAYNWILGRQAMFLMDFSSKSGDALTSLDNSTYTTSLNVDGAISHPEFPNAPAPLDVYQGLVDLVNIKTFHYPDSAHSDTFTTLFGNDNTHAILKNNTNDIDYRNTLESMMYLGPADSSYYLWANPKPNIDDDGLKPWQVAQMASIFGQNVSDFAIDFAGDYGTNDSSGTFTAGTPDGKIDRWDSGDLKGSIIWYSGDNSTNKPKDVWSLDSSSSIVTDIFTGSVHNPIYNNFSSGGSIFIFRHDDINTGVDPDDKNYTHWPWLLRIRYRIHDYKGEMKTTYDGDKVPGQWYSIIVPIKQPKD